MEEVLALIDKIIEEHNTIIQRVQTLEQVANDVEAMIGFKKATEALPVRFERKQNLQKLQELLETISQRLRAHFNREETALLTAFEKHGDRKLLSTFRSLLLEHEDLRNHLVGSRKHVAELIGGGLSHQVWEASVHDTRDHISNTRKLLEAHAGSEQGLLQILRSELMSREKEND